MGLDGSVTVIAPCRLLYLITLIVRLIGGLVSPLFYNNSCLVIAPRSGQSLGSISIPDLYPVMASSALSWLRHYRPGSVSLALDFSVHAERIQQLNPNGFHLPALNPKACLGVTITACQIPADALVYRDGNELLSLPGSFLVHVEVRAHQEPRLLFLNGFFSFVWIVSSRVCKSRECRPRL